MKNAFIWLKMNIFVADFNSNGKKQDHAILPDDCHNHLFPLLHQQAE